MVGSRGLIATAWSAADGLLRQAVQLAVAIVLARLVSPAEFGTVALLALFLAVAGVMADGGLGTALIQRQDLTHTDESTVFWIQASLGGGLALCLWASAPLIASFFDEPILEPLTALTSLNVLLGALGGVHLALLIKSLDFRALLMIGVLATVLSGTVAVILARQGHGVWALAIQSVVLTGCTTAMLWLLSPWRPALTFSRASARGLFSFGGYMLAAHLTDTVFTRAYTLLLGKLHSVRELGYYVRADSTQQLPTSLLSHVVSRVTFPLFSEAAGDPARLRRGVRTAIRALMLLNVPMMLGTAAVADPLVSTLFGERWGPAAPILQVLCIAGVLLPLHVLNLNVLMAQGHARLVFRLELVKKSIGVLLLLAGALFGIMGVAWAYASFSVVAFGVNAHYTGRILDYGAWAQMRDVLPVGLVAVPMALVIGYVALLWDPHPAVELLALSASGAAIFLGAALGVRLRAIQDLVTAFRGGVTESGTGAL